jgi:O-antigen ligase
MWWGRLNRSGRALLLAGAALVGLGIYSTFTRSVWLGAGLGLVVLLGLGLPRSWRVPALGTLLLTAAAVGATQWTHILAFKRDRDLDAQQTLESVKLRPVLAVVAWNMFLDRPMLGCGFGQYAHQSVDYLADRSSGLRLEKARPYAQHNVLLALLVETGLLGMGLYVALLALWLRDAWRVWRSGTAPAWARHLALVFLVLLANYLANGAFHDLSLVFMVNMLLFFMAGLTSGLRGYGRPRDRGSFEPSEQRPQVRPPCPVDDFASTSRPGQPSPATRS